MKITTNIIKVSHLSSIGLWDKPQKMSILDLVKQLSYIQIDAIYTVARSQDIVAHTRSSKYREKEVWKALKKGELIEGWAHARSLIPKSHFPYYYSARLDTRGKDTWWQKYLNKHPKWPDQVLKQLEKGPISVSDIVPPKSFPNSTGWNSPKKRIVDYLEGRGYIIGSHDVSFRLTYDLVENIIEITDEYYSPQERFLFHINNTLDAIGITPMHKLLHYSYNHRQINHEGKKYNPRKLISENKSEYGIEEIIIEKTKYYKKQDFEIDNLELKDKNEFNVFLLSPFDNSLWSRESLLSEYSFDYKMEIYVPEKKRKFGYYVMPILWGTEFVGRVDVKFDRKTKTMNFNNWYWEKTKQILPGYFWEKLAETITRFCEFHDSSLLNLGDLKNKKLLNDYIILQ